MKFRATLCLLLAVFLLVSCGETATVSDNGSSFASTAESSVSMDSAVEESAPVIGDTASEDSSAESSEAPSVSVETSFETEETSSEASEDPVEPDDPKEDDPMKNSINVLLGKRYTRSALFPDDSSASYPDEGNKSLTDGKLPAADGNYSDPAFAGFNTSNDYSDRGYASIVVDLDGLYLLDKFEVYVGTKRFLAAGISAPAFAWVYASHDGETWHKVGITSHRDTDEVNCIASTLVIDSPITARYLEFRIVADASRWMFLAEVMAYGVETDKEIPYEEEPAPELGETALPQKSSYNFLFIGNSATYVHDLPATLAALILNNYCNRRINLL